MSRLIYHRKKETGYTYVYEVVEEHWDKEKKQMRSRQRCIGKLDPATGELIPSKRLGNVDAAVNSAITAQTTVTGPRLLLEKIDQEIGLTKVLKKACPEHWELIMSLAEYLVCTGKALAHAESWCLNHETPFEGDMSSQRISEFLGNMNEDERQTFFKLWGNQIAEHDYLCYDITSVSSYAEQNEFVRYGYNRDHEKLAQINLGMVYGQKSLLPVSYRQLPGSITDVVTVRHLLDQLDKLEYPRLHLIMDRGFYSQKNINALAEGGHNFTIGIPTHLKWIREEIDQVRDEIDQPGCLNFVGKQAIYVHTRLKSWGDSGRRCYLHFFYDDQKSTDARMAFDNALLTYKIELEQGKQIPEHKEAYEKFFICHTTPKRGLKVAFNNAAIEAARKKYAGFQLLLSTKFKDPMEALKVYREKDAVEKCFDDLKNELDMNRLRVHNAGRMQARLFIQFIALILLSQVRKVIREKMPQSGYTAKGMMMEMESLTTIHYSGKYNNKLTEITKAQREILTAFGVEPENTL
ncbi:MAG TPA: transposase [Candidatus Rifleibacterium sp.]|nr:transposase [Candidatus Rifleibacterium sp.]